MTGPELAMLGSSLLLLGALVWGALRLLDVLEHALDRARRRAGARAQDQAARSFLDGRWR